jgi:hypothetical protein
LQKHLFYPAQSGHDLAGKMPEYASNVCQDANQWRLAASAVHLSGALLKYSLWQSRQIAGFVVKYRDLLAGVMVMQKLALNTPCFRLSQ